MNKQKKIIIFDLDDTLIRSDAKIKVLSRTDKVVSLLTPAQFNSHTRKNTHSYCFKDFDCEEILSTATLIPNMFRSLKRYYKHNIPISIITARNNEGMIIDFFKLKNVKLKPSLVYGVDNARHGYTGSVAARKKLAIMDLIKKGYNTITYYDDNLDNLNAAKELISDTIKIKTIHIMHD